MNTTHSLPSRHRFRHHRALDLAGSLRATKIERRPAFATPTDMSVKLTFSFSRKIASSIINTSSRRLISHRSRFLSTATGNSYRAKHRGEHLVVYWQLFRYVLFELNLMHPRVSHADVECSLESRLKFTPHANLYHHSRPVGLETVRFRYQKGSSVSFRALYFPHIGRMLLT